MTEPIIQIHTCIKRIEYVESFMMPRLIKQGFKKNNIHIWNDKEGRGCLRSYIDSWSLLPKTGHTWHLQDDILLDRRFYQWACDWWDYPGIIAGFGNRRYYKDAMFGVAHNQYEMFYSFPCIRIPNRIVHDWLEWFETAKEDNPEITKRLAEGKYIDYFFKLYIGSNIKGIPIYNFKPCIAEHVDEYIGGSTINFARKLDAKALVFEDEAGLKELKQWAMEHSKDYEV